MDHHYEIIKALKLVKIHQRVYLGGVSEGILMDHLMSIKHGLKFLRRFLYVSENKDLIQRAKDMVSYVVQQLQSLRYVIKDESLVIMHDLREKMKNVIINPGTNEYDIIFPEIIILWHQYNNTSVFLCKRIDKLLSSDYKANQINPVMKELEDIRNMIKWLGPFFTYAERRPFTVKEQEVFIPAVLERAACFIYLSFVGIMDDEMVFSLKNSFSHLIIEEAQIMKMYLTIDINSVETLESHISMSLRLLEWNKKLYLRTEMRAALEDHFMSIDHGLQFLVQILEISTNNDLKLRIQHLVSIVKHKLYLLPHYQEDENLVVKLEDAYGELREEMVNVVMKPGTDDYDVLCPEPVKNMLCFFSTNKFLVKKIRVLVTLSCKADQITPVMKELEELTKKLTSLYPLAIESLVKNEEEFIVAITTFLDRATSLVYFSFIGKLTEDMLVSLRKHFSLLIGESEINEMTLVLGVFSYDELKTDVDISLSLLKRHEESQICTINEAMLEDHIFSLKHGIEFLQHIFKVFIDDDLKRRVILLARNMKQELERLRYIQESESLNMDMNGAYADLRDGMKKLLARNMKQELERLRYIQESESLNMDMNGAYADLRENNDFLVEKISILITSNCKANQIAPLKKELQDLRKMLAFLKPLLGLGRNITYFSNFLHVHHKATLLIYWSLVGKMDIEMMLLVKSNISIAIKEIDILEIYTLILNEMFNFGRDYLDEDLYLLENLILLLKSNVVFLSDANSKLYEALIDIHIFVLGLSPNVFLRKLHPLKALSQDILRHSIPIIYSCYLEHTEVNISVELNCVLDLIKHIKSEVQEVKVHYFPRVDDLGFMEFFVGHLEDLMKSQEISIKEEIVALHFEVHELLSLAKVRNQEFNETPWTDIINMAYQAEYIVDLYLVTSPRELGLIASLSKIIEQLKNIRADMIDGVTWDSSHLCKSLPAQDRVVTSQTHVLGTTTQVSDNDAIVGLQEESRIIMEHLFKGENKLDVVLITGMAGVGKTTLASTLYKTSSMADHFDILAWCTVSQSYQNRELLLAILDQVKAFAKNHKSISDDQELADQLCKSLKKRRFLIVFDDIWDTTLWNYLKRYLPDDRNGSRILITTRNKDVSDQINGKVDELHGLSEEESWELFLKKVIDKESLSDDLLKCSKRIVEHCKGLPLSVVVIAGVLNDIERTKSKWNEIAERVNSLLLSDTEGKCKAILELSYNHLPNHLRSCFLYLGSYPEDKEISVKRLTMRWIGEGLIQGTRSDSPEEVAKKYVADLIVKSLVIPAKERSQGGVKTFRLHDLLRDFCLNKAKEMHFFTVLDKRGLSGPLRDPRQLIINGPHMNRKLGAFSCHSIRSLISNSLGSTDIKNIIEFREMVLLKVLDVEYLFPNISSLVHLQYLAMREVSILPDLISKLRNLQVLILSSWGVIEVPDFIWDMVKLRHVHIYEGASFKIDSNRLENSSFLLENLRSLSRAYISLGDFKWLSRLSGLQRLSCRFGDLEQDEDVKDNDLEDNKLQMLRFNSQLTSLKMESRGRKRRFISTCALPISLRKLTLSGFHLKSNDLSKIGSALPNLEVFKIDGCYKPSLYKWNVDDEDFPMLKVLKLKNLDITKLIVSEDSFPNLEQLWVEACNYLDEIPLHFGNLLKLRFISVIGCKASVEHSAREIEKIQHEEQNTEMKSKIQK